MKVRIPLTLVVGVCQLSVAVGRVQSAILSFINIDIDGLCTDYLSVEYIAGMDCELLWATKQAIKSVSKDDIGTRSGDIRSGDYGWVPKTYRAKHEDSGILFSKGYEDSGGW